MNAGDITEIAGKIAIRSFSEGIARGEETVIKNWSKVLLDFNVPVEVIDAISKLAKENIAAENSKKICGFSGATKGYCEKMFKELTDDCK